MSENVHTPSGDQLRAAGDFARDLPRNPPLRARLKEVGFDSGQDVVVVAMPGESGTEADRRAPRDGQRLLAKRDEAETCGWSLEWLPPCGSPLPEDAGTWTVDEETP